MNYLQHLSQRRLAYLGTCIVALFIQGSSLGQTNSGSIVGWGDHAFANLEGGFIAISAGTYHGIALNEQGSVVAWGRNLNGQCNVPVPNKGIIAIAAGGAHSLALNSDGWITAWGSNEYGQSTPPVPNSHFTAVAAGGAHSVALKDDGSIFAWGYNALGQTTVPVSDAVFISIAAGDAHSLALRSDGSIIGWGYNDFGQINIPDPNGGFIAIAAGEYHSMGLRADGTVATWGYSHGGQLNVPVPNSDFVAVAAGKHHSLGLKGDGSIVVWGCGIASEDYGQCTLPSPNSGFVAIAAGEYTSVALRSDGAVITWGLNVYGQSNVPVPNSGFVSIAASEYHNLGLRSNGSIATWACDTPVFNADYGQCNIPHPNTDFISVAAGFLYSLGLKANGSIVGWGYDTWGIVDVPAPNSNFTAISAGGEHALALRSDKSLAAWGRFLENQTNVPEPNSDFTAMAAGGLHSLGLKADGSVVAWGAGGSGQTGDPHHGQSVVPQDNTGFIAIAAGDKHSLALRANGTIETWGDNSQGQLDVPAPNTGFIGIAAGLDHSVGMKEDGSLVVWGNESDAKIIKPPSKSGFIAFAAGGGHILAIEIPDCNGNALADDLDIALGTSADCNANAVPDACDLDECNGSAACADCNFNNVPDSCDVSGGTDVDVNDNGVPDSCEFADYNIGTIPDLAAYAGHALQFRVHSDLLGPGAVLLVTTTPTPLGSLHWDPITHLFDYDPSPQDRVTFTVRFAASIGSAKHEQDVQIQPLANLVPEVTTFGLTPGTALPNPESVQFQVKSDVKGPAKLFNTTTQQTRSVTISGKRIVLEPGHSNGLYLAFNGMPDIEKMTIAAETLVIKGRLHLPQTNLSIFAKTLRFEDPPGQPGKAQIDVTPKTWLQAPTEAQANGGDGHHSGSIDLQIQSLVVVTAGSNERRESSPGTIGFARDAHVFAITDPNATANALPPQFARFFINGGRGQDAGRGMNGSGGQPSSLPSVNGSTVVSVRHPSNLVQCPLSVPCGGPLNSDPYFPSTVEIVYYEDKHDYTCNHLNCSPPTIHCHYSCKSTVAPNAQFPGHGGPGQIGGRPGSGGDGGRLTSNIPSVAVLFEAKAGISGNRAQPAPGGPPGIAGTRGRPTAGWWIHQNVNGVLVAIQDQLQTPQAGAPSPEGPPAERPFGDAGDFNWTGQDLAWLVPGNVRAAVSYARAAYLKGYASQAGADLREYATLLEEYSDTLDFTELPEPVRLELNVLHAEVASLLQQIDSGLDYFGNPTGWVPMLSFEVNRAAFDQEIERAIGILYLVQWLKTIGDDLEAQTAAMAEARVKLDAETESMKAEYFDLSLVIDTLDIEATRLTALAEAIQQEIKGNLDRLEQEARDNLRLPFWKKALKIISRVVSAVPSPQLHGLGIGLGFVADITSDTPWNAVRNVRDSIREFKAFRTASDKIVEIFNNEKEQLPWYIKQLGEHGKPVAKAIDGINDALKATEVAAPALQQELDRLKAADPMLNTLVDRAGALSKEHEAFTNKMAQTVNRAAELAIGITNNLMSIAALNTDLAETAGQYDEEVEARLDLMEKRTRERLIKYHYVMAKAFEYRMLMPYPGELDLECDGCLLDRMLELAAVHGPSDANLTSQEFAELKNIYIEQLSAIKADILGQYNNSNQPHPVARDGLARFALSNEQVAALNEGMEVAINLHERVPFSTTFSDEEDVRIVDLKVYPQGTSVVVPPGQGAGNIKICAEHGGVSTLERDGKALFFQYFTQTTNNPLIWCSRYDVIGGDWQYDAVNETEGSLLQSLVPTNANVVLFSRPGAWDEVVISRGEDVAIPISALSFELNYEYRRRPTDRRMLKVVASPNSLNVPIWVGSEDLFHRQDGFLPFRRAFLHNTSVTLQAPERYGFWAFDGWTADGVRLGANQTTIVRVMDRYRTLVANYVTTCDRAGAGAMGLCMTGPDFGPTSEDCVCFDRTENGWIDLQDFARLVNELGSE